MVIIKYVKIASIVASMSRLSQRDASGRGFDVAAFLESRLLLV